MLDIQQDGKEHLDRGIGEQVAVPFEHVGGGPQRLRPGKRRRQGPTGELEDRFPSLPKGPVHRSLLHSSPPHLLPAFRKSGAEQGRLVFSLERPPDSARSFFQTVPRLR